MGEGVGWILVKMLSIKDSKNGYFWNGRGWAALGVGIGRWGMLTYFMEIM